VQLSTSVELAGSVMIAGSFAGIALLALQLS
jgi:hypothetical protein